MRQKFLNTVVFVFALVFLAETTGIAVFVHSCHGSRKTEFSINSPSNTCCCGNEETHYSHESALKAPECCKNEIKYFKVSYTGFPVFEKSASVVFESVICEIIPLKISEQVITIPVHKPGHSPPVSGKELVYFIHQIRIPNPAC